MSLSRQIFNAIRTAKRSLGDMVLTGQLIAYTTEYQDGEYVNVGVERNIDIVPDQFSYEELTSLNINEIEVKLLVFNVNDDLVIKTEDKIRYKGDEYSIYLIKPESVGALTPVYTVMLKK